MTSGVSQTEEPSTRPKHPESVDTAVETDEPSTRPKHHVYEEASVQTEEDGEPPIKRKRRARFPDSAEEYTPEDDEQESDKENETAPTPMPHEKNALPIVNWRRSGELRPIHSARRVKIPKRAKSGFETAGRQVPLPVPMTMAQVIALGQRAATPPLPAPGQVGTVNNPIVLTSPVRLAPHQGGAQGAVVAPAVAAPRQGGAPGAVVAPAVAAPRQGGAQGAAAAPANRE